MKKESGDNKTNSIAPGIYFSSSTNVEKIDIANYDRQKDVITKIAKRAFDERTMMCLLCFGMAGTGKTSMMKVVKNDLNNFYKIDCSLLEIRCNTLIRAAHTIDIAENYIRKAIFNIIRHRPIIVSLDELDALAQNRVHVDPKLTQFSLLVCSLLDAKFDQKVEDEGQVVVVGITNDPAGVDDAVRDRLGVPIYMPLPTIEVIREIIQKQGFAEFEKIADRLIEYLGGDMISPRGLVLGCVEVKKHLSNFKSMSPDDLAKAILGASSGIKSRPEVDAYERRNETFIKHSKFVLNYWGK